MLTPTDVPEPPSESPESLEPAPAPVRRGLTRALCYVWWAGVILFVTDAHLVELNAALGRALILAGTLQITFSAAGASNRRLGWYKHKALDGQLLREYGENCWHQGAERALLALARETAARSVKAAAPKEDLN